MAFENDYPELAAMFDELQDAAFRAKQNLREAPIRSRPAWAKIWPMSPHGTAPGPRSSPPACGWWPTPSTRRPMVEAMREVAETLAGAVKIASAWNRVAVALWHIATIRARRPLF